MLIDRLAKMNKTIMKFKDYDNKKQLEINAANKSHRRNKHE